MYDHTFYKQAQICRSDIRPHIKWAVSLVILHMITSIFLHALCGYIWVNILTFSPRGEWLMGVSWTSTLQSQVDKVLQNPTEPCWHASFSIYPPSNQTKTWFSPHFTPFYMLLQSYRNSFYIRTIKDWNRLHVNTGTLVTLSSFKDAISLNSP